MRITRFHLILALMALAVAGLFISELRQRRQAEVKRPAVKMPAVIPPIQPESSEQLAKKAIAVAGEYWKITKNEFRDYATGGATLRNAKQAYVNGNYEGALNLARLSIDQLKSAKKSGVKYRVKHGDCLWKIAKMKKHYGRGTMWYSILRANEKLIKNYRLIFPKQVFFIPWVRRNGAKT